MLGEIPCVLYAAKSTEDLHGSIPGQLEDCRETVERSGGRLIAGEYSDEARSAYSGDRGPGLADAMRHTEELVREHGTVELWAQHSDRLARGDGRTARHAVEIALWALKRDIRVRTIQDPDTFRDLLYAVVTGQRNHEDSRRKGLALAAGRRRAVERGEYTGHTADGYRVAVSIEDRQVIRRLEIDPDRRGAIELILRLGLRGKTSGQIAEVLNRAGWRTKPRLKHRPPRPWRSCGVLVVLHNPRYAGLAATHGEIVGEGQWPAYITPRQHQRIQKLIAGRLRRRSKHPHNEPFLLSRLAKCGRCGRSLLCHTGIRREDGTFSRRYICDSHWHDRPPHRCDRRPIDADILEAMFATMLPTLLTPQRDRSLLPELTEPFDGHWTEAPERQQLREAALSNDDASLDLSIERMVARVAPELTIHRQLAATRRETRQQSLERRVQESAKPNEATAGVEHREQTFQLNAELHDWFTAIHIHNTSTHTIITGQLRAAPLEGWFPEPVQARLDRRVWARASTSAGRRPRRPATWSNEEIIAALQEWATRHGRPPNSCEWLTGSPDRPGSLCVRRRFGSWERALHRARLTANARGQGRYWSDTEIEVALRTWTVSHGRAPRAGDWTQAQRSHPCSRSVSLRYGTFQAAVTAAGLNPA
ncbi:MAG: recombinase family protein [Solirubrobacteraceae bacterium]